MTAERGSPNPHELDVHVWFFWDGLRCDYRAGVTAAANLAADWERGRGSDLAGVGFDNKVTPQLVRMPCEQLFLYP